jgi:hydroxymethylpyrimidine pyrophosphatase-like HAD family hydrolase
MNCIKSELDTNLGNKIRYQQNVVNITVFPLPPTEVKDVEIECKRIMDNYFLYNKIKIFTHVDSIDILPFKLDKSLAVELVSTRLEIPLCNIIAVGDGVNDIEMLKKIKRNKGISLSVGTNSEVIKAAEKNFSTGYDALTYILEILKYN